MAPARRRLSHRGSGLEDPSATTSLQYEPVGSLAGTLRVKDRAVDFGASDMPLTPGELANLGLGQFPIAIGGVVVAINVAGIGRGDIKLTGPVLADMFLGKIATGPTRRSRRSIPRLKLPKAPHHRRPSIGRLGHDVQLHQLPVEGQPGMEAESRLWAARPVAGRHRRQGQRGRRAKPSADAQMRSGTSSMRRRSR